MGYQALLFCLDEKNARTVTQVLSELEFAVEPCAEPFAAVKKLMAQHFDAVVVDCENEQNATLLFRSARNSTSNSGSLAVAVVEGQAGVAKAFRIGANLVLTKPINVEQTKGTLRVARGLLRKSETVKPGTPAAGPTRPAPQAVSNPTPVLATQPVTPASPATAHHAASASQLRAGHDPIARKTVSKDAGPLGLDRSSAPTSADDEVFAPAPVRSSSPAWPQSAASNARPGSFGGAASAPAAARTPEVPATKEPAKRESAAEALFEKPEDAVAHETQGRSTELPAPSFTFGGANVLSEAPGGSKKAIIGIAAAVLIAAGAYAAWPHLHSKSNSPSKVPQQAAPAPAAQPVAPSSRVAATMSPVAARTSSTQPDTHSAPETTDADNVTETPRALGNSIPAAVEKNLAKPSAAVSLPAEKPEPEPPSQPIVVRNGSNASLQTKRTAPDAPAPSALGIAQPGSGGTLSNLIPEENAPTPVLETLNISQGVSQGLLVKKVQPTYPANALRMHVEGAVNLLATISKSGNISSVKVLNGPAVLSQAAVDAVKQWKYKPYLLNGEPVEIQTQITINFKLPRS